MNQSAVPAYQNEPTWNPPVTPPVPGKKHILCIGDSTTYGSGVIPHQHQYSYPAQLQTLLGAQVQVMNYGLRGRTCANSGDFPYQQEPHFPAALHADADCILIMLGTNDTKAINWQEANYRRDLTGLVQQLQAAQPQAQIFLMLPCWCYPLEDGLVACGIQGDILKDWVLPIVAETAQRTGCGLIDLYHLTEGHPDWFSDGVHPNQVGNRRIAEYIASCL